MREIWNIEMQPGLGQPLYFCTAGHFFLRKRGPVWSGQEGRGLRKWPRTAFLCSTDIEEMKCSVTNDNMLKVKNVIFIFQLVLVKMSSIASLVFSAIKNIRNIFISLACLQNQFAEFSLIKSDQYYYSIHRYEVFSIG